MFICKMWFCENEAFTDSPNPQKAVLCKDCTELTKNTGKFNGSRKSFPTTLSGMVTRTRDRRPEDHNIDVEHLYGIWPKDNKCPILKTPFTTGGDRNDSPSLDRIDSSKGYQKGNVRVISTLANRMLNNASRQELKAFATWIMENEL